MEQISLSRDTVLELNRMMYTLYKFFSVSLDSLAPDNDVPHLTADEIHLETAPHDFVNFQCGDSSVRVHQVRTHYTLEICGFTTTLLKPYRPLQEGRYRNYYGDFSNLESAKNAFFLVVKDWLNCNLGALY